jgi:hypothetical protein
VAQSQISRYFLTRLSSPRGSSTQGTGLHRFLPQPLSLSLSSFPAAPAPSMAPEHPALDFLLASRALVFSPALISLLVFSNRRAPSCCSPITPPLSSLFPCAALLPSVSSSSISAARPSASHGARRCPAQPLHLPRVFFPSTRVPLPSLFQSSSRTSLRARGGSWRPCPSALGHGGRPWSRPQLPHAVRIAVAVRPRSSPRRGARPRRILHFSGRLSSLLTTAVSCIFQISLQFAVSPPLPWSSRACSQLAPCSVFLVHARFVGRPAFVLDLVARRSLV